MLSYISGITKLISAISTLFLVFPAYVIIFLFHDQFKEILSHVKKFKVSRNTIEITRLEGLKGLKMKIRRADQEIDEYNLIMIDEFHQYIDKKTNERIIYTAHYVEGEASYTHIPLK